MTKSLNKTMIIGNLGADPEVRSTQSGTKVANLRVATNEQWTTRDGQKQEHTEWHRVVFFGPVAEICEKYLSKGRRVFVEGNLRTNKWTDQEGNNRYTTELHGRDLILLDGGSGGGDFGGGPSYSSDESAPSDYAGGSDLNDDDIPF